MYVTSSTLDGKCKELQVEDGDEDQGRQLSACAAWVQDQEEDADGLEDFVMEQVGNRANKQTNKQTNEWRLNKTKLNKERKEEEEET